MRWKCFRTADHDGSATAWPSPPFPSNLHPHLGQPPHPTRMDQDTQQRHPSKAPTTQELPPEILGIVFQCTVLNKDGFTDRSQLLVLCLVCKAWYEAALLDRQIWGRIDLSTGSPELQTYERIVTWLDRSSVANRAVKAILSSGYCGCWEFYGNASLFEAPCVPKVLCQLLETGPRLGRLEIECYTTECFDRLCSSVQTLSRNTMAQSLKLTPYRAWIYKAPGLIPFRSC